ncbi:hypothetical protein SASPL_125609 [Salvia splendens]|uniref:DUF676 domain-containing protein n=1 Tax=Salvia splendens TaxID=180675 RepID=A0A8X8XHY4_SALSN|nr:hypothetical protein SASPL_125609 [Salvia splendens]
MSVLLQHLKWMINGFNKSSSTGPRRLKGPDAKSLHQPKFVQPHKSPLNAINLKHKRETLKLPILGAIHEISIYIHRFHNLDLFQQGWYQLKITIRWENDDSGSFGTPARVVQYEAPDLGSDDIYGVWRIDDTDHSFSTQPFRIRYARQDIPLAMMVSFNLSLSKLEDPSTYAVIVKFELLYAPVLENRYNVDACLDTSPAAVHEFRLPPKAVLGLHAYCPVRFDAFHAVLVDTSVHASLLKSEVHTSSLKVPSVGNLLLMTMSDAPSDPISNKPDLAVEHNKIKQVMLFKALSSAHDILLEELQKLSKAIDVPIEVEDISSSIFFGTTQRSDQDLSDAEIPVQVSSKPLEVSQKHNGKVDFQPDGFLYSLSEEKLVKSLDLISNQVNYLWSTFLNFHRANAKKILESLCNQWAVDRKAEWSIWMVYTKAPAQTAAMRAELHRRSIAQMRVSFLYDCGIFSLTDLHIFGDPSRIPIVIVERVVSAPVRSTSGNFYFNQLDQKYTNGLVAGVDSIPSNKLSGPTHQTGRVLKIVVFVHGFQACSMVLGHHLDLRLVRNQWLLIEPKAEFLMSEVNEDKTSGDFREIGQRLAQEVVSFVKKKMDKASRSGVLRTIKLSFVGHSIGNIILRTALTETIMEPYLRFLHTYVSVSGPHLGYIYSSNSLFNGGLWLLKKLKGTQCIHQLTFTDDPDLQNTFLYKLCKEKTLEHFKNIILLSSPQDGYVPYHSARIEMCPASSGDYSKKGKLFLEMLNEYLDQIRAPSSEHRVLLRCDVNFDISLQRRNLNTLIRRAAHIEFLETDIFAKFIMWSFPELFR